MDLGVDSPEAWADWPHLLSGQALFDTIQALKATERGCRQGNSFFYQRSGPFEALHNTRPRIPLALH